MVDESEKSNSIIQKNGFGFAVNPVRLTLKWYC